MAQRRWTAGLGRAGAAVALVLAIGAGLAPAAQAQSAPVWRDTGVTLTRDVPEGACFDGPHAGVLLASSPVAGPWGPPGSYAIDTAARTVTRFSERTFDYCDEATGFSSRSNSTARVYRRFSRADPVGRTLAHPPTVVARDGSRRVYALEAFASGEGSRLWASADFGDTWTQRPDLPSGLIAGMAVSAADARALYALSEHFDPLRSVLAYSLYFSPDAGATWDLRHADQVPATGFTGLGIAFLPGLAPVTTVQLSVGNGIPGSNAGATLYLERRRRQVLHPGGRLVHFLGYDALADAGGRPAAAHARATPAWAWRAPPMADARGRRCRCPSRRIARPSGRVRGLQSPAVPASLLLSDNLGGSDLWYTADSGAHWQSLGPGPPSVRLSPYAPLTLYGDDPSSPRLRAMDLPDASRTLTAPAPNLSLPDGRYFTETQHNLGGPIRAYWDAHGGLAQFGYPRTEAFREVSPTDGQVYMVQYFERNRLEYHPEHAGTPYEVCWACSACRSARRYARRGTARSTTSPTCTTPARATFRRPATTCATPSSPTGRRMAGWRSTATRSARSSRRSAPTTATPTSCNTSNGAASSGIPRTAARPTKCCSGCSAIACWRRKAGSSARASADDQRDTARDARAYTGEDGCGAP